MSAEQALPCPFCGAEMTRHVGFLSRSFVWEHPLADPCPVRGATISVEGLPMWNRRPTPSPSMEGGYSVPAGAGPIEAGHTPLPWHTYEPVAIDYRPTCITIGESLIAVCLGGGPKRAIGTPEERANAAFIVRACNNHHELVKALEFYADQYCEGWCKEFGGYFDDCGGCHARHALAKATTPPIQAPTPAPNSPAHLEAVEAARQLKHDLQDADYEDLTPNERLALVVARALLSALSEGNRGVS